MYIRKHFFISDSSCEKQMTLYLDPAKTARAAIVYFHGGGLLYGSREDLPEYHIEKLTSEGFCIAAYDYPLAPSTGLEEIAADISASVNDWIGNGTEYLNKIAADGSSADCSDDSSVFLPEELPYFLWGRSAGAYLCLITAALGSLKRKPAGLVSYYGYGLLTDNWADIPSSFFNKLPKLDDSCLKLLPAEPHCSGDLDTHYAAYVYGRQTGRWMSLVYTGKPKYLYSLYSLRLCDPSSFPCRLFCAHCIGDTDVPFSEFQALADKYSAVRFIAAGNQHDFDRDIESEQTARLLKETVAFLESCL